MSEIRSRNQSIRLFENPILEACTKIHPAIPALIWGPVAIYFFYRSSILFEGGMWTRVALAISGILTWSLVEYVLHRFVFHFEARTDFGKRIVYLFHGIHHDSPQDFNRLVMPPFVAAIFAVVLYSLAWLIFAPEIIDGFFAGFLVGYLIYDYTHFFIHAVSPRNRWGKALKQNHMVHHFVNPNSRWGVSSPLWDYVFNTFHASPTSTSGKPRSLEEPRFG